MIGQHFFRGNRTPLERLQAAKRRLDDAQQELAEAESQFAAASKELDEYERRFDHPVGQNL